MKRFHVLILTAVLALGNVSAQSTVRDVVETISRNNLPLQALAAEQEAEYYETKGKSALSGPSVEYSPFYQDGISGVAESELIVSEEFEFPTKYVARRQQLARQSRLHQSQYRSARRKLQLEAEQLCYEIIHKNQSLQMLQKRLEDSESLLQMFQKRMEAGDATILELNKVKLDRMDVLTTLIETQSERLRLLGQLQELNGGLPISLGDTLYPDQQFSFDLNAKLDEFLSSDYDIFSAEEELKLLQYDLSAVRQEWLPNLTVGYRRNTEGREALNGFMVGVSFPVLWSGSNVKAARKRQLSAELQLEEVRQSVANAVRTTYMELEGLCGVIASYDVPMMHQTLALLAKALQHGQITALEYYTEIDSIYEKLESHLTLRCEAAKLQARLNIWHH